MSVNHVCRQFTLAFLLLLPVVGMAQVWQYVDPRIGSVGVGRTFPGPCMPFGMVKPGPDCGVLPNSGWAPMPEPVSGFSQTHVSGTGGGQKYGNILIQPFIGNGGTRSDTDVVQRRVDETISLGYYATTYEDGIRTEITTSERCAHYRLHYPTGSSLSTSRFSLLIDATHFLGKDSIPDLRERQQFVGADIEVVSNREVQGYSRIRGGWNNGDAYTVYFCLQTDKPFVIQTLQTPPPTPPLEGRGADARGTSIEGRGAEALGTSIEGRGADAHGTSLEGRGAEALGTSLEGRGAEALGTSIEGRGADAHGTSLEGRGADAHSNSPDGRGADALGTSIEGRGAAAHGTSLEGRGTTILHFTDTVVQVKVGISYVSTMQARRNIDSHGFNEQLAILRNAWEQQLRKVQIEGSDRQKRIFYTALYHTMLMPVCKTGENPKWTDSPYYDDYYAIWDTYRTSSPLLTLLWPERQVEIVNSLLNIYAREGYMPDARSGDCNGRTQGGSNADVVIADAFVKGLGRSGSPVFSDTFATPSIDYALALEAMLKDGEADPGADHEKHGRGGLNEYRRLGYVPYGIARAGTRTVEYAYNDYCLAQVARGLDHPDIYDEYMQRSGNWRNLWRSDYEWDDVRGYIMPRDDRGQWLDSVPWGRSRVFHPTIPYTPVTKVAPWYLPWWDTFFYEALSAEYSLSIPHDVPGLIEACGGAETFRRRLDMFFERGRYNVGNEPSFLTPCLYHWIGRPDLSTQRIHQIVNDNYSDRPDGLPGNDDSGAMSSWLAFHILGIYPNAGQDYYLLNTPMVSEYTFALSNGRTLRARRQKGNRFAVFFNGRELPDARITHQELMQGGELVFMNIAPQESAPQESALQESAPPVPPRGEANLAAEVTNIASPSGGGWRGAFLTVSFTLNRQFRTWPLFFCWEGDTLTVVCKQTTYRIPRQEVEHATGFCWLNPQTDGTIHNDVRGTFLFVSADAMRSLSEQGFFRYDNITWRAKANGWVRADIDGTEMLIEHDAATGLALVREIRHNPLGIDWKITNTDEAQ